MKREKNGFTLIELLATIIILSLVFGIGFFSISNVVKSGKKKSEEVFAKTIEDALNIYIDYDAKKLEFTQCSNTIRKTHNANVVVYKAKLNGTNSLTFSNIYNSGFNKSLTEADIVNPGNKEKACVKNPKIYIYKDADGVYYYKVDKADFKCFTEGGIISNLPDGFSC